MRRLVRGRAEHTSSGMCVCGCETTEADRSGRPGHRECIDRLIETVARESHPYDDARGVAERRAEAGWPA